MSDENPNPYDDSYIDTLLSALDTIKHSHNYTEAIDILDHAIELDSSDYSAYLLKAIFLNDMGEHEESLKFIKTVLKLGPENSQIFLNKISNRSNEEEIGFLSHFVHVSNFYSYTYTFKGRVLSLMGEHQEAIRAFDKAIEVNPNYSKAYSNKGNALTQLSNYDEAISCFEKSIELNRDCKFTYYNLANTLKIMNRYEDALDNYNKAISLSQDKESVLFYNNKGLVLLDMGRREEAVECFEKCLKLEENPTAYLNKAIALMGLNNYEEVLKCVDSSLVMHGGNWLAYFYKAKALHSLGMYKEAEETILKALEIEPNAEAALLLRSDIAGYTFLNSTEDCKNISTPSKKIFKVGSVFAGLAICAGVLFYFLKKKN
jgi:tetratricopeptide (TPR) repeat protein